MTTNIIIHKHKRNHYYPNELKYSNDYDEIIVNKTNYPDTFRELLKTVESNSYYPGIVHKRNDKCLIRIMEVK
jgi:hypothetical protein